MYDIWLWHDIRYGMRYIMDNKIFWLSGLILSVGLDKILPEPLFCVIPWSFTESSARELDFVQSRRTRNEIYWDLSKRIVGPEVFLDINYLSDTNQPHTQREEVCMNKLNKIHSFLWGDGLGLRLPAGKWLDLLKFFIQVNKNSWLNTIQELFQNF